MIRYPQGYGNFVNNEEWTSTGSGSLDEKISITISLELSILVSSLETTFSHRSLRYVLTPKLEPWTIVTGLQPAIYRRLLVDSISQQWTAKLNCIGRVESKSIKRGNID